MELLVHEIETSRYQELTTNYRVKQVVVVRPHLYRHGSPAGTVTFQIQEEDGTLVAESANRNIADIGEGTYWHGYTRFDVSASLAKNTAYRFAIVTSGYTFSSLAYIAWVNGYALGKYDVDFTPESTFEGPLDLEIWTRRQVRKGIA